MKGRYAQVLTTQALWHRAQITSWDEHVAVLAWIDGNKEKHSQAIRRRDVVSLKLFCD